MTPRRFARIAWRAVWGLGDHPVRFLSRVLGLLRARIAFRRATVGTAVIATGSVDVDIERAEVRIGSRVTFRGGMIPTRIKAHPGSTVAIGDHTMLNYAVDIDCVDRIEIGADCMFGSMVTLCDHTPAGRAPIVIEDGVWVAHGVCIGPGVRVGHGSVLAAGSAIVHDVPANSMAIGRPARVVSLQLAGQSGGQAEPIALGLSS